MADVSFQRYFSEAGLAPDVLSAVTTDNATQLFRLTT
jgi:hypothetical protein